MGNGFKDFYNDIRQEPDGSLGERMGSGSPKPIEPLKIFDAADWNGKETEPRLWVTIGQIPRGEPGILNGDGGTGKTTISLQLANAVADDQPDWLGKCVDTHGPTIIYSIEEKLKELHRRVAAIRESRNLPDLKRGRLLIISDLQDPVLAKPDS